MDGMPCAAAAWTRSSGVDAPSRKLKAERACSSMYISRKPLGRTISFVGNRNKYGRGLAAADFHAQNEAPGPTRRASRDRLPTSHQKCARVPKHEQHRRNGLETWRESAGRLAISLW